MKEKGTDVCPVCGQITQPSTQWLIKEQWEQEVERRIKRELGCHVERIYFGLGVFYPFGGTKTNIPASIKEWIADNPAPKRSAKDPATIADLARRVSALEAAIAKKGGLQ